MSNTSGCKCKETAQNARKYSTEETMVQLKGIKKIIWLIKKLIIIVLVLNLFIIITPFIILIGIIQILKGKKLRINLTKIIKLFHVKN